MRWNPELYARFATERGRAFEDLLARVSRVDVRRAVDLGCGDGKLTRRLVERWPKASVTGVELSPEMLEGAEPLPGVLQFVRADAAVWRAAEPVDLIFSNALLHWIDDHARLLDHLCDQLAPGGTLAVQMPYNFAAATHLRVRDVAQRPRWKAQFADLLARTPTVRPVEWYAHRLLDAGFSVDAWETTYVHVLSGPDAVATWIRGTTMRPYLSRLDDVDKETLWREVADALAPDYPERPSGTLLPFRRIFFVASRVD